MITPPNVLALDVGDRRIGVARASLIARLPETIETIDRQKTDPIDRIQALINEHQAGFLVVGLPRGMDGQETKQTAIVRDFAQQLQTITGLQVDLQDEAVTSIKAEDELRGRGVSYEKADIDALAAVYILEDWLASQPVSAGEVS